MGNCDCGLCCNDPACGGHDRGCIWWDIQAQQERDRLPCEHDEECGNDREPGTEYCYTHRVPEPVPSRQRGSFYDFLTKGD